MPIVKYECNQCAGMYDTFQAARDCENRHKEIVRTCAVQYGLRNLYPLFVEITFADGHTMKYIQEVEYWNK